MTNKRRAPTENRSEVVLFRMRPSNRKGLIKLAEAYDLTEAATIRRLLEPVIDEELELLREQTSMRGAALRQRTQRTKMRLKASKQEHTSKLRTG